MAGGTGAGLVRTARRRVRKSLRRSPETNVAILDEAPAPPGRAEGYQPLLGDDQADRQR
jgi:hypothetical protein